MNIKNIAFSGFAAAILAGVCGVADAATVNLASKSYVDNALAGKASIEDFANLESTVGQKATQTALKEVADQVIINTNDIAELKAAGYLTDADLTDYAKTADVESALASKADASALKDLVTSTQLSELLTALEAEIAQKQNSGDYATADALQDVSDALAELKADSYTKAEVDQKIADAISGGEIDLSGYAKQVDLDALTQLVSGNTTEINKLKNAGYQTSDDVQGAITTAVADLATKSELNTALTDYTKTADLAAVAISGSYNDLDDKPTIPSIEGLATSEDLTDLQTTLEAAIDEKQAKGDYLVAEDLKTLNEAVEALQSGKADASTVTAIQETISKLGDTYASKADMTAADQALQAAIDAINVPSLEGYVKASDLAAVATSGSYNDLDDKPTIPSIEGLATSEELTTLQTTLEAAIDEKQAKGDYLVAADLTTLNDAITALQSGKADASTVTAIQETISKLGDTYASKADMTAADQALQAAIDNMDLSAYAKAADVYSKTEADAKFLIMRDANVLGANLQWDEDGKLNTKGIATAEGLEDLENKVASAVTETELDAKGYLTASSIATGAENGTIAVNGTDVPVKGLGSAAYSSSETYVMNPTLPTENGDYMLMVEYKNGETIYTWTNIEDYHPSNDLSGDFEL